MPFFTLSAVPVLPAISYPGIFAKFAVPSFVETTFLKIGLILLSSLKEKINNQFSWHYTQDSKYNF